MVKLAMAWSMTHPDVTAVLVGGRETRHIDNGLEAYRDGLDPGSGPRCRPGTDGRFRIPFRQEYESKTR